MNETLSKSTARAFCRRHWALCFFTGAALSAIGWASFAPIHAPSRDVMFEIPEGTWARRMAGNKIEILPKEIRLTIGLRDILVLKNSDDVPQIFGPTLMMPGQSFRLPFALASTYQFVCTAHASGQMTIVVEPFPAMPWARLRWRVEEFLAAERLRQEEGRADRSEIAQTQAPPIGSAARREGLREMANRGRAAPSARSAEGPAPGTLPSGG